MANVRVRWLYYLVVGGLAIVWLVKLGEEILEARLRLDPLIGLVGAILVMALLVLIFFDRESAQQVVWPGGPPPASQASIPAVVVAVRVVLAAGVAFTLVLIWPTIRAVLSQLWPK